MYRDGEIVKEDYLMVEETQTEASADKEVAHQPETQAEQAPVSNDTDQTVKNSQEGQAEQKDEKKLTQSEVNRIVAGVKLEAQEKGRREALAEANTNKPISATKNPETEQITLSPAELEQLIADTATKQAQQQHTNQVINQFADKVSSGEKKYPDFAEKVAKLNLPQLPWNLIELANSVDNTADVVYELANNPSKFSSVLNLCNTSVGLAHDELMRLSDSIKKNQQAAQQQQQSKPNEPLDQTKPSTIGTDNGEKLSVSALRKQPWLRC